MAGFPNAVQNETNGDTLVKMLSNVILRKDAYDKACDMVADVQKSVPVFKNEGFTLEEWASDIKLKLKINNTKERYDKLMDIKKQYTELMDKEDKMSLLNDQLAGL
jgi:hypothetical protein